MGWRGTNNALDSEKKSEMVHSQRCTGERLGWNLKWARKKHRTVKKKKSKKQEYRALTTTVGERLGWTRAQKKSKTVKKKKQSEKREYGALTAMVGKRSGWRGPKSARDSEKRLRVRSENTAHPWRCAGERLRWN